MGLGMGCLFIPATGLVAQYFRKRIGLAMGIVSTGSTIGLCALRELYSADGNKEALFIRLCSTGLLIPVDSDGQHER
jgi:hypothetical protein